jgi:hypothetical protein
MIDAIILPFSIHKNRKGTMTKTRAAADVTACSLKYIREDDNTSNAYNAVFLENISREENHNVIWDAGNIIKLMNFPTTRWSVISDRINIIQWSKGGYKWGLPSGANSQKSQKTIPPAVSNDKATDMW